MIINTKHIRIELKLYRNAVWNHVPRKEHDIDSNTKIYSIRMALKYYDNYLKYKLIYKQFRTLIRDLKRIKHV